MPTVNVNIQPAILNWALGQTNEEKLGKKLVENVKHWLDGSKCPTFNQIEEFSKKTHIPIGYFFYRHRLRNKLICWNIEQGIVLS